MCGNAHKTNIRSGRLLRPREGKRASRVSRQNACATLFWHSRGAAADAKGVKSSATRSASANSRRCRTSSSSVTTAQGESSGQTCLSIAEPLRLGLRRSPKGSCRRRCLCSPPQGREQGLYDRCRLPQDDRRRPQGCEIITKQSIIVKTSVLIRRMFFFEISPSVRPFAK